MGGGQLPQIAFFGSSVGEMGFDCRTIERITKKSAYNFSLTGTNFSQYEGLINAVNIPNNNVKVVVLAETIFSFNKINAITDIERYLPNISNKAIYQNLYNIQPDLAFKCRYIPFYKYITVSNKYYVQSIVGFKNWWQHKQLTDTLLGQIAVERKWEADQDSIWKYAKPIPVVIDNSVLNNYKKMIARLVANGKKVIITIPPIYMPQGQKIVDITQFRKTLASIANNKNIFFWDFSQSMVDKQYFYNVQHLNAFGAGTFCKAFADSLNTIYK